MCCKIVYVVAVYTVVLVLRLCVSGFNYVNNFTTHKIKVLRLCLYFVSIFYIFDNFIYLTIVLRPTLYIYIYV